MGLNISVRVLFFYDGGHIFFSPIVNTLNNELFNDNDFFHPEAALLRVSSYKMRSREADAFSFGLGEKRVVKDFASRL